MVTVYPPWQRLSINSSFAEQIRYFPDENWIQYSSFAEQPQRWRRKARVRRLLSRLL
jgi:hypothetical protein